MVKIAIVGLQQVGKTTLFRILTRAHGEALGTGKPEAHVGVVRVPDSRLDRLTEMHQRPKAVHASVEYVDTPGSIIELARTGERAAGLREIEALAHVVRHFDGGSVSSVDPHRDIESVELELILSDLAVVEKRLDRLEKDLKKQKSPALEKEYQLLRNCKTHFEKQMPLREFAVQAEEERVLRGFAFLTSKPVLYVLNVGERDIAQTDRAEEFAAAAGLKPRTKTAFAAICGKVEAELAELDESEARDFLASYGLREPAIDRLIRSTLHLLGLISFFTIGENECRSWTIRAGATALEAAGVVHSDFQKKFIRAEVVRYEDLVSAGNLAEARHRGLLKLEGKEYVIGDGEVVYFRHSA